MTLAGLVKLPATRNAPAGPSSMTALLARVWPAARLSVEVAGIAAPAAPRTRKPGTGAATTVRLAETATARVEMPHWPAALKVSMPEAEIPGAPNWPAAFRVSTRRQGGTV